VPEPDAGIALAALEPNRKAPSETVPPQSSEPLGAAKPPTTPLLVPKLQLERTPSGNLKAHHSHRGETSTQLSNRPQSSRRSGKKQQEAKQGRPPSAQRLPKKEGEMLPLPLEKDILKAQLHEPEPTELPKVAKREITQISEEQLNEYDEECMGSNSELGSDEYYEEEEV